MNFFKFFDKLNSKQIGQNPGSPNLKDMELKTGGYELKPLGDEDMARAAAKDVEKAMWDKAAAGVNNTRLGEPMTDEELRKFMGLG
jgi:hypothetical protein